MTINTRKLWMTAGSYAVGFAWVYVFLSVNDFSWQYLAFALLFAGWVIGSFPRKTWFHREDFFWLGCMLLAAASMALRRGQAVDGLNSLALHGFAGYWVLCRAGLTAEGISGLFLPLDLLDTFVISPFGNFLRRAGCVFRSLGRALAALRKRTGGPGAVRSALITAAVLILAAPVLVLAAHLLGQADESFAALIGRVTQLFTFRWEPSEAFWSFVTRLVFSLPVGAYLFGLVSRCSRDDTPRFPADAFRRGARQLRIAPAGAVGAVLAAFLVLYLLFFTVQAGHLLAAFRGDVPGTLTAAQFAREGFFQLCSCMAINFSLLFVTAKVCRVSHRQCRPLRLLDTALMGESIFLAVTAASKLALYIHRFGFTPLRLLSMWWIGVLTAGCALALAEIYRPCRAGRKWILLAAGSFALLCLF